MKRRHIGAVKPDMDLSGELRELAANTVRRRLLPADHGCTNRRDVPRDPKSVPVAGPFGRKKVKKVFLHVLGKQPIFHHMKKHTSRDGNVAVEVVLGIVAVVGVVLGIAAVKSNNSVTQTCDELRVRLDNLDSVVAGTAQLESDVRQVRSSCALLGQDVQALKDQLAKKPEPVTQKAGPSAGGKKEVADAVATGPGDYHTIKSGDLLGRIAKQYGTTSDAIEKLNPGINAKNLKVGKKIRVK